MIEIQSARTGPGALASAGSAPARGQRTGITAYGCDRDEHDLIRESARRLGVEAAVTGEPVSVAGARLAAGNRCVSVDHRTRVTGPILQALGRAGVRYLSTRSIGVDHIDLEQADRAGITVGNVEYSPAAVADYTLMLMVMSLRHTRSVLDRTAAQDYRPPPTRGRELRDLTVGVVGTGRIGAAVVDRLTGFGCRILAHDPRPTTSADYVPLEDLLRRSDVVTLHVPLDARTRQLLDRARLGELKDGAILVNTGRGALVDTEALADELERGRLGGAALDVLEGEDGIFGTDRRGAAVDWPVLARLQRLPNVIVTPHVAYHTDHALRDVVESSLLRCLTFESGCRDA
jgi:D-specific alpha-keto acid dehydrogenase